MHVHAANRALTVALCLSVGMGAVPGHARQVRAPSEGAADRLPTAIATRPGEPIDDGRLDERAWQAARPIGPLLQRDPREGEPASEEAEVRILYDADALYFGITCRDRTPAAVVATQLTRDANLEVDDRALVILDPFFDHRNGFFFEVNPAGARVTKEGWTVEIAIPFKTLSSSPVRPRGA